MLDRELRKGSGELLILSLVDARPRHGYEISKLIQGKQVLAAQRDNWREFVDAIQQITGPEHA